MKKTILLASALIVAISISTGFVLSRSTQSMKVRIHAKDLPEYGLVIIKPSDPSFDNLLNDSSQVREFDEAVRPLSIAIKNNTEKTVVAYAIIWELTNLDGQKTSYHKVYANSESLIEGKDALQELTRTHLNRTIEPGATLFISAFSSTFGGSGLGGEGYGQNEISSYSEITASIDGAFFDDGSFVGPDTTDFFNKMKAQVDAKLELFDSLSKAIKGNKSKAEIFQSLETNADSPLIRLTNKSTSTEHFNHFKKFYSNYLLQLRKTSGDDEVANTILRLTNRPRLNLRKVRQPE